MHNIACLQLLHGIIAALLLTCCAHNRFSMYSHAEHQLHRVSSGHPSLLTVLFKHQQVVINKNEILPAASFAQKLQHMRITILQRLTTLTNKHAGKFYAAAWVPLLQCTACAGDTVFSTLCTAFGVLASFAACM